MRILFHAKGAEISAKSAEDYARMDTGVESEKAEGKSKNTDSVSAVGVGIVLLIERKPFPKF